MALEPDNIQNQRHLCRQEDQEEEFPDGSDDSLSSTDYDWQETLLYTTLMVPVTRQLNIPNAHLRLTQIASALRWDIVKVHSDYELNSLPSDLIAENLYGRLVRHVDDLPSDSDLVLVLIDTTFHRQPPSWQPQIVRKAMYSLPRLTAAQFLRAMYLSRYCDANELPCLVYRNERIWRQDPDIAVDLANGDYFRLEIPPMHNDRTGLDTRCLAVANASEH